VFLFLSIDLSRSLPLSISPSRSRAGFFEQKAAALNSDVAAKDQAYRDQRKQEMQSQRERKAVFKERMAAFK
jgi:hypothetical protein